MKGGPCECILDPQGPGSVAGAPNLPAGFTDTFTSHYLDTGRLRQHAVIGGQGPPLLVHGWPEKRLLAALTKFLAPTATEGDATERRPP